MYSCCQLWKVGCGGKASDLKSLWGWWSSWRRNVGEREKLACGGERNWEVILWTRWRFCHLSTTSPFPVPKPRPVPSQLSLTPQRWAWKMSKTQTSSPNVLHRLENAYNNRKKRFFFSSIYPLLDTGKVEISIQKKTCYSLSDSSICCCDCRSRWGMGGWGTLVWRRCFCTRLHE